MDLEDKYASKKYFNEEKGKIVIGYRIDKETNKITSVGVYELPYLRCSDFNEIQNYNMHELNVGVVEMSLEQLKKYINNEGCKYFLASDSFTQHSIKKDEISAENIEKLLLSGRYKIDSIVKYFKYSQPTNKTLD